MLILVHLFCNLVTSGYLLLQQYSTMLSTLGSQKGNPDLNSKELLKAYCPVMECYLKTLSGASKAVKKPQWSQMLTPT